MEEGGKRVMTVKRPFEATTSSRLTWQPGEYRNVMRTPGCQFEQRHWRGLLEHLILSKQYPSSYFFLRVSHASLPELQVDEQGFA